jgi:hypothetical protein
MTACLRGLPLTIPKEPGLISALCAAEPSANYNWDPKKQVAGKMEDTCSKLF